MHKEVGGVIWYVTLTLKLKQTSYQPYCFANFDHISSFVYDFTKLIVNAGQNREVIVMFYSGL